MPSQRRLHPKCTFHGLQTIGNCDGVCYQTTPASTKWISSVGLEGIAMQPQSNGDYAAQELVFNVRAHRNCFCLWAPTHTVASAYSFYVHKSDSCIKTVSKKQSLQKLFSAIFTQAGPKQCVPLFLEGNKWKLLGSVILSKYSKRGSHFQRWQKKR